MSTPNPIKKPRLLKTLKLRKAAIEFATAWAAWHNHGEAMPDEELIDASHGILEAMGFELVENSKGETVVGCINLRKKP